jgi:hypothetical protein
VRRAHDDTRRLLELAAAEPRREDPNAPSRALDSALGVLSEHLAAAEAVLYPAARRRLTGSSLSVPELVGQTRAMERTMRSIAMCLGGEIHAVRRGHLADLRAELAEQLEDHERREALLIEELRRTGDEDGSEALASTMSRLTARAPTRPHPYAPRSRVQARVAFAFNAIWDRFFDLMEGRSVPRLRPPRPVPAPGKWSCYLLGTQTASPAEPQAGDRRGAAPGGERSRMNG